VAAILAQMRGNAVRAGIGGEKRRAQWIGMPAAAGVTDGRHMVDVDAEAKLSLRRDHVSCAPARPS
jgi:hypothetical protein